MTTSDPIADFLTRIRNAILARHRYIDLPVSKVRKALAKLLQEQGYIEKFLVDDEHRKMRVFLKYSEGRRPVITGLKRISRPSLRRYVSYKDIPRLHGGMGTPILSTPMGIVDGETARKNKVGGEMLCYVW